MKDTPQDPQSLDAAFDARCRELLQSRSVPAPEFVEPVPPVSGQGRKWALAAGAVIAIGISAALWPSGQPEAPGASAPSAAPAVTTAEPVQQPEAPALESPAPESMTAAPEPANDPVAQPAGPAAVRAVQEEAVTAPAEEVAAAETAASRAEVEVSSPDMIPVSSTEGTAGSTPEPTVAEALDGTESTESTLLDEEAESVQIVPIDSPAEEPVLPAREEPAVAPKPANEPEEPTLRLPLTLPAGGGL